MRYKRASAAMRTRLWNEVVKYLGQRGLQRRDWRRAGAGRTSVEKRYWQAISEIRKRSVSGENLHKQRLPTQTNTMHPSIDRLSSHCGRHSALEERRESTYPHGQEAGSTPARHGVSPVAAGWGGSPAAASNSEGDARLRSASPCQILGNCDHLGWCRRDDEFHGSGRGLRAECCLAMAWPGLLRRQCWHKGARALLCRAGGRFAQRACARQDGGDDDDADDRDDSGWRMGVGEDMACACGIIYALGGQAGRSLAGAGASGVGGR